jgi:hypothetical protein
MGAGMRMTAGVASIMHHKHVTNQHCQKSSDIPNCHNLYLMLLNARTKHGTSRHYRTDYIPYIQAAASKAPPSTWPMALMLWLNW